MKQINIPAPVVNPRPAPADGEARALVGCCLLDPAKIGEAIAAGITQPMFDDLNLAIVFRGLVQMHTAGQNADVVTVCSWLKKQRAFTLEPAQFLNELQDATPSAGNISSYFEPVKDAHRRLGLWKHADRLQRLAWDFAVDSGALLADEENILREMVHGATKKDSPAGRRLFDLPKPAFKDENELLRNRFLCRQGAMLLSGPTGIGKSSLSMQCMILWGLGRPCFKIEPTKPLKSVLIQAENDDDDLAEFRDGVALGLGLTPSEIEQVKENVIVWREDTRTSNAFFDEVARPLLEQHSPDLVWIDPALAYLGGETTSQADVGGFLRNGLSPLLHKFNCAAIIVHHTNKPSSGKEKPDWQAGDFAYLGSGSAEWANYPRAILALRSVGSHKVFELRAAKRGGRLGWKNDTGETVYTKMIAHATEPGVICWRDADQSEVVQVGRPKAYDVEEIFDLLPEGGFSTSDWIQQAENECGVSEATLHRARRDLLKDGRILKSAHSKKWQPIHKKQ
jgi:hypothetical protein